jgi:DNA polymerase III delta prime subunit
VVIKEADTLNSQASNAILKILEEPPAHTVFFLLTPDAELLLQTIRSRCQSVRFPPFSEKEMINQLQQEATSSEAHKAAVHWSEGRLERAQDLLQNEDTQKTRALAIKILLLLWRANPRVPPESLKLIESITPDHVILVLDSWYTFTRDLAMLLSTGENFSYYHEDSKTELKSLATQIQVQIQNKISLDTVLRELTEKCEKLHKLRVSLDFNVNQKLALDAIVCELQLFSIGKTR